MKSVAAIERQYHRWVAKLEEAKKRTDKAQSWAVRCEDKEAAIENRIDEIMESLWEAEDRESEASHAND